MNWFDNIKGENFLAVLDVMMDIKNEIDIMADSILIPLFQTKTKFQELLPIDSVDMRDKYCNLRWKAAEFLKKNGIIKDFKIHKAPHRWDSLLEIKLEKDLYKEEFERIEEEFKKSRDSEMSIEEKRKMRFQFLYRLYEISDTNINEFCQSYEIGDMLDISNKLTTQIIQYLEKKGFIKFRTDQMATISITQEGIDEVENALLKPEEPTEHFPPAISIIQIGEMKNSQIIQASSEVTQIKKSDEPLLEKLKELTESIQQVIEQLKLNKEDKTELEADIQTIDAQLSSSKPKKGILKECISSIRRIFEGVTVQVITSQILDKIALIESLF